MPKAQDTINAGQPDENTRLTNGEIADKLFVDGED